MVSVRPLGPPDLPQLEALFARRFGQPLHPENWEWKYLRGPGEGRSVGAFDDEGRLLAHAGMVAVAARWNGSEGPWWQGVDFVAGEGGFGLRPPIVRVGRRLLGDLPRPGDLPWNYGFPSRRHEDLGERAFGYLQAGEVEVWQGPVPAGAAAGGVEVGERPGPWCEAAWQACATGGTVRSLEYLEWRYWARPDRYYRFYRLPSAGRPDGLVVAAFLGDEAWLAEVSLPPGGDWEPGMLGVAADLAAAGIARWRSWPLPASGGGVELLARLGLEPAGERLVLCSRGARGEDRRREARQVHYSMGDYDLV